MSLAEELNPRQWEAVRQTEGPLLVVAGAGSGKTRAITFRILYLIRERAVDPESILAITFTNKAAREMKDRVFQRLPHAGRLPWISTFHSFCLHLLRRHIGALGYSTDFVIYDAQDQAALIKKCMKEAQVNEEAFPPKSLLAHISGFKNDFLMPGELNPETFSYGAGLKAVQVYPVYQNALRAHNALDFDDLLVLTVRLLEQEPELCDFYNDRYRYLLVDEFQDTNRTQYRLIQLLSRTHRNVCVVGDDDQSIYSWRGANLENILHFERDFPGTRVIKLEQNYRSTQTILQAAGAVVRENQNRKDKTLWTENETGEPVVYYRAEDELDEARAACERLLRWHREEGLDLGRLAILYRTNAQSRAVEDQLRHLGLAYQVVGGLKFYERREVKDVLAYLRVILNPTDSVSLKRIVNLPARGIGKTTVEKVEALAARENLPLLKAFRRAAESREVGAGPAGRIAQFLTLMDQLGVLFQNSSALDFLQGVLERTGYLAWLEKDKTVEGRARLENLESLYNAVEEFVEIHRRGTLRDFLDSAALVADQDQIEDEGTGRVLLMTLHTCKGLEFDGVVILGLENGLLPHAGSLSSNREYEEERRLCYVGFTRARKHLMVTNARRRRMHGNTFTYPPSDFLMSIPEELLSKEMTPPPAPVEHRAGFYGAPPGMDPPPVEVAPPSADARRNLAVGTRVVHPKFGPGVVVLREGGEEDLRVTVFFKSAGKKKLAVNQARLIVL